MLGSSYSLPTTATVADDAVQQRIETDRGRAAMIRCPLANGRD